MFYEQGDDAFGTSRFLKTDTEQVSVVGTLYVPFTDRSALWMSPNLSRVSVQLWVLFSSSASDHVASDLSQRQVISGRGGSRNSYHTFLRHYCIDPHLGSNHFHFSPRALTLVLFVSKRKLCAWVFRNHLWMQHARPDGRAFPFQIRVIESNDSSPFMAAHQI